MYVNSIFVVDDLAIHPWDGRYQGPPRIAHAKGYDVRIVYDRNPGLRKWQLRYSHLVLAIYKTIVAMAEKRPGFFESATLIDLNGQSEGLIVVENLRPINDVLNGTLENRNGVMNSTLTINGDSIVDPEDEKFVVEWRDHGRNIPVQDILFAIFDGLASLARFDQTKGCSSVHGISLSGNAVLFLGPYADEVLQCGRIRKALVLIATDLIVGKKLFSEEEFELKYNGKQIGQGFLMKMTSIKDQDKDGALATS